MPPSKNSAHATKWGCRINASSRAPNLLRPPWSEASNNKNFQSWIKLKGFDESLRMNMFTLHADGGILCLICSKHPAVTTSRGNNGNIYTTDPAIPPRPNHLDNHLSSDQHQKGLEKTLNAFHYFPAIHQDRISD